MKGTSSIMEDGTLIVVWLSGGTNGQAYTIINQIETRRGLIDERTIVLKVKAQ